MLVAFYGSTQEKALRKLQANIQQVKISLRETAHREVMERAARGPRTALPSHWLLRNTRSRKNHAAQILYARQRLDRWRA